jgi:hypothetical protein
MFWDSSSPYLVGARIWGWVKEISHSVLIQFKIPLEDLLVQLKGAFSLKEKKIGFFLEGAFFLHNVGCD